MAANKTVVVLAPNGRRQNVKVTINTTILQVSPTRTWRDISIRTSPVKTKKKSGRSILDMSSEGSLQVLEEVCQKQGYNPDDYDIK